MSNSLYYLIKYYFTYESLLLPACVPCAAAGVEIPLGAGSVIDMDDIVTGVAPVTEPGSPLEAPPPPPSPPDSKECKE